MRDLKADKNEELVELPDTVVEARAKYTGHWRGSKCHGHGVFIRPGGSWYEGVFVQGRANGHGKFMASKGETYEGQWDQHRAHGKGKYIHEDGSSF